MSYDIVRNGLVGLLNGIGFEESGETVDFKDSSDEAYENQFILICEDGEADENNEQQAAFLYDNQKWTIQIAFSKGANNDKGQRDELHRKKDEILTELDEPDNWGSFCTLLRYRRWSIEARPSYFVLTIELKVKDALNY